MKAPELTAIEQEFYRGNYRNVLHLTTDAVASLAQAGDLGWIIGALSFLGRIAEAETLFESKKNVLSLAERMRARFFLGIGFARQSHYSRARHFFALNLRERRAQTLGEELTFFAYQGLCFNRYFSGRFSAASWASKRAQNASVSGGYLYGKTLSFDIRGHILVQGGEIQAGLRTLEQAREHAMSLNNGAIADAIQISISGYRAEFGLEPRKTLNHLEKALKKLTPQDTYSRSGLLLELARQHMLRGNPKSASQALDEAAEIIYATQNRRHEVLLNLRYSYLFFLSGEPTRALSFIRSAKKSLDPAVDHSLALSVLGLECKLLRELGKTELRSEPLKQLSAMNPIYGGQSQKNMNHRELGLPLPELRPGADPLGHCVIEVASLADSPLSADRDRVIDLLLRHGYLSFLYEILKTPRSAQVFYVDLHPGSLTLLDRGHVWHSVGLTGQLRSLLGCIAQGPASKQLIVEKVWGYAYHPLRHDPIVYTALTALRKLLGERSHWIEMTETGYRLTSGVRVELETQFSILESKKPHPPLSAHSAGRLAMPTGLNLRQLKILHHFEKNSSDTALDTRSCARMFKTSEITASRDLSFLCKRKYVIKIGRGRATKYLGITSNLLQSPATQSQ